MAGDLAAAFGDPGAVHGGRNKKRREVLGQEARIAIQGVNFADRSALRFEPRPSVGVCQ